MPSSDSSQDSSQPEHEIVHEKNLPALMRDGTTLYANVTRPAAGGPYPGLVERTPYGKEGGSENTVGSPEFFARRGYAVVIQDVRGRFASEGDFYPFRDDGAGVNRDGFDTIQWTADQFLALYRLTGKQYWLDRGQYVLALLSLYQQVWDPPFYEAYLFGGFGVMNTDGEWNDGRQSRFVPTYADYYVATGNLEYLEN